MATGSGWAQAMYVYLGSADADGGTLQLTAPLYFILLMLFGKFTLMQVRPRPWTLDPGPWTLDPGIWTLRRAPPTAAQPSA